MLSKSLSQIVATFALWVLPLGASLFSADLIRELQTAAVNEKKAQWGQWGYEPGKYSSWTSHSNRLIPAYVFGANLSELGGANSPYRSARKIEQLYGTLPEGTLNPSANYFDQTDLFHLQRRLADQGKKYIILMVFDGMDWQTSWAAAVYRSGRVGYTEGRGSGLHFQDYRGTETDFGFFVSSPHNEGTNSDVDAQIVTNPGGKLPGGYDVSRAGDAPWSTPSEPEYLIAKSRARPHAYTDSSSAASSLTTGIKLYNNAVNVDIQGKQVDTIAHLLQRRGWSIGVVTSVPISHATPACAYAHNVDRDDYQDLTRDMLGLPSIAHKTDPLPGVDVLIGGGWGENMEKDGKQGQNYVAGNRYLSSADLAAVNVSNGMGKYRVAQRTPHRIGREVLLEAAEQARKDRQRLLGLFGVKAGHLPFQTADGNFDPTQNANGTSEKYTQADIFENPTLADMTRAALHVLEGNPSGFWMMIEAGDVDWANHANNIDNSIGAVLSGDAAFRVVTDWAEAGNRWHETAVILTADHGHYLILHDPSALVQPRAQ